ncbi:MAG: PAS domain S-box protein [Planctomycetota bacterium]|jgi:PAS domain S-box-containing protein
MHASKGTEREDVGKEQPQTSREQRPTEGFFRSLIRYAPNVILLLSRDHRILEFNPEAERLYGYKRADVLGKNYLELFLPSDARQAVAADVEKVLAGEPTRGFENAVIAHDGQERILTWNVDRVLDSGDKPVGIVAIGQDITERKRAEKMLQFTQFSIDNAAMAAGWTTADGRLVYVNAAACRLLGYSREELLTMKVHDIDPSLPPEAWADYWRELKERGSFTIESHQRTKDGRLVPVEVSANFLEFEGDEYNCGFAQDITKRKKTNMALRENEKKYRSLIAHIPDVVWTTDHEGRTTFISSNVEKVYGYTPKEIYQECERLWFGRIHPDDAERVKESFEAVFEKGVQLDVEYRIRRKDGEWIWLQDRSIGAYEKDGMKYADGVFSDITERKKAREALTAANQQLSVGEQQLRASNQQLRAAQEELCESEAKWRSLIENAPNFIMIVERDGTIQFINRTMPETVPEQTIGRSIYDYIVPDDHDLARQTIEQVFLARLSNSFEARLDVWGRRLWFDSQVGILERGREADAVMIIATDITERKEAEEALRVERDKLRVLMDGITRAGIGVDIIGTDHSVLFQNETLEQRFGEIRGAPCYRHFLSGEEPCDPCPVAEAIRQKAAVEVEQTGLDGRDYQVFSAPLPDADGTVNKAIEVVLDVTERKQAQRQIEESERKFRTLAENIPGVVYRCKNDEDWTMIFTSDSIHDISGYPVSQFTSNERSLGSIIHPDDRERVWQHVQECLENGRPFTLEYRILNSDGDIRWVYEGGRGVTDQDGQVIYLDGAIFDITDRKQAQESLRKSEQWHHNFLTHNVAGVWRFEFRKPMPLSLPIDEQVEWIMDNGVLVEHNDALARMYGLPNGGDAFGATFRELHQHDEKDTVDMVRAWIEGGYRFDGNEFLTRIYTGEYRWFLVMSHSVIENGHLIGSWGSQVDITERKEAEQALRFERDKLQALMDGITRAGIGIDIVDADHRILFQNQTLEERFGKLSGKPCYEHYIERGIPCDPCPVTKAVQQNVVEEVEQKGHDGRDYQIFTAPVPEANGSVNKAIEIILDITERKQAEEALRESEERFRSLSESSPVGVFRADEKGAVLYTNPQWQRITGLSFEESLGFGWVKALHPDDKDRILEEWDECLRKEKGYSGEFRFLATSGEVRWVHTSTSPIRSAHGDIVGHVGMNQDITERKLAEEVMKKSAIIIDSTTDAVISTDITGNITFWNKGAEIIYGYRKEEVIGKPINILYKDEDLHVLDSMIADLLEGKDIPGIEVTCIGKNHRDVEILLSLTSTRDRDGNITEFVGITKDITESKRLQDELKNSEEKYKTLVERVNEIIYMHDPDFILTYVSPQVEKITGYTAEELIGQHWASFATDNPINKLALDIFEEAKVSGRPPTPHQIEVRKKDGDVIVFEVNDRILRNAGGDITGVVGSARDITERKKAEEALKMSEQRYRAVVEDQTELICRNLPDGTITFVNEAYCRYFDKSRDELIGQKFIPLIPEEDHQKVKEHFASVEFDNPVATHQHRVILPNREIRWHQWTNRAIFDDTDNIIEFQGTGRDITKQKQAEEELRENEKRFRSLSEAAFEGIAITEKGEVVDVNDAFLRMYDCSLDELKGKQVTEFVAPEHRELVKEKIRSGYEGIYEHKGIRKDGSLIDLEIQGRSIIYQGRNMRLTAIRDITEQKKARLALEAEKRFTEEAIDAQIDTFFVFNPETGKPIIWNKSFSNISGYSDEEIAAMKAPDSWYSKEDLTKAAAATLEISREGYSTLEMSLKTKSGDTVPFEYRASMIKGEGDAPLVISIGRDIAERQEAERQLQEYQAQLKSLASELSLAEERERRRVAAGLHDNIAQKLAMAKFSLQSLQASVSDPDVSESLEKQCQLMDQVVADARSLTFELSNPVLYQIGLEAAVESYLTERIQGELGIKCKFTSEGPQIHLDEDVRAVLFQAVRELLANVVKHANASTIDVCIVNAEDRLRVVVEDDGVGFDPTKIGPRPMERSCFGLFNIRERLEYFGGNLKIEPGQTNGVRITMTVTVKADAAVQ